MEPTNYFDMTTEKDPEPILRITKYRMVIAFLIAVMACASVFSDNNTEKDIKLLTIIAEAND